MRSDPDSLEGRAAEIFFSFSVPEKSLPETAIQGAFLPGYAALKDSPMSVNSALSARLFSDLVNRSPMP
jgi:hypothetical protein